MRLQERPLARAHALGLTPPPALRRAFLVPRPQVTLVNSCYASKSAHPEQLLESIRAEWLALKAAAVAPADVAGAKAKAA
jgi:hypothetical protein